MTRSKRFEPVSDVTRARERDAAKALGRSQRELDAEKVKLDELIGYRNEYARRYREALLNGLGASAINDYQQFLARLDTAIEQQRQRIEFGERQCEASRQQWLESRQRFDAVSKVMDRYRADEQRLRDRRDQLDSDERAQRMTGPSED